MPYLKISEIELEESPCEIMSKFSAIYPFLLSSVLIFLNGSCSLDPFSSMTDGRRSKQMQWHKDILIRRVVAQYFHPEWSGLEMFSNGYAVHQWKSVCRKVE